MISSSVSGVGGGPPALRALAAAAALALLSGCASLYFHDAGAPPSPPPRYSLAELPQKEYWTGIVFNGAKVGFSHTRVAQTTPPDRFEIASEAVMHFRFLSYDKRVQMRARDTVDASARLLAFDYEYLIDESAQHLTGDVRDDRLRYRLSGAAGQPPEDKEEALREPLYPAGALDLLPVLQGLQTGKEYRWLVFEGQTRQISEARQAIEAYEKSDVFEGTAFKVKTNLLGQSGTTWIDTRGRPIFALASHGVIISALEEEADAKRYLAAAALNKEDVLVSWSLVKAQLPLADPRAAAFLRVEFLDPPKDRAPLSDERQRCQVEPRSIVCEIDARIVVSPQQDAAVLRPSAVVPSNAPAIRALGLTIAAGHETTSQKVGAILAWIDRNIRKEPVDAFSALDVLESKRGECQGRSYLFAALARSLGVPTRLVNGLAYSADHGGFLYHTWAESLVDGAWRALDPTFAQAQADATHIALLRGENMVDLIPLVDWVGNTRIRVLEAR